MKTVAVSARAKTLINILNQAQKGGLILRSPEGREFVITEIDEKKYGMMRQKTFFRSL